jgi:indolepyruvate ferredoxin oxidoreductase, beta subunit
MSARRGRSFGKNGKGFRLEFQRETPDGEEEVIMPLNLIIAGVGGQGNVLASQILGKAAVQKGFRVTIGETFGLSQRGGPVMSHVRLSDGGECGPLIPPNGADLIVGLEPLETLRVMEEFAHRKTVLIVNSRPIFPLNVIAGEVDYPDPQWIRRTLEGLVKRLFWLDGTGEAMRLGGPILLNMVMLGALCGTHEFPLAVEDIAGVLREVLPESKLELNFKALNGGGGLVGVRQN